MTETVRRVVLVDMDTPKGTWSSRELESELVTALPGRRPVVLGAIAGSEVDSAFRKLRQLAAETERDDSIANRMHSAAKALSFFRDMFPTRFWDWFEIGKPHDQRQRLLRGSDR